MPDIQGIVRKSVAFWDEALVVWGEGGWAMYVIAVVSFLMFAMGIHVHLNFRRTGFRSVSEMRWRRWIDHPDERVGPLGRLLDLVADRATVHEAAEAFSQVRRTETLPFERDLKVMKMSVGAAPLVGLLGTVTGMLTTFGALSSGSGGDQTMGEIAAGISEALITTETGLVVAIPGLFYQHLLARKFEKYQAFLAHLETVCNQALYRKTRVEAAIERTRRERVIERIRDTVNRWIETKGQTGQPSLEGN